jgi:hypothetical protein
VHASLQSEPSQPSAEVKGKWEALKNQFVLLRPDYEQEPSAKIWLAKVMGYESGEGVKNYLLQYWEPKPGEDPFTCMWHANATQRQGRSMHSFVGVLILCFATLESHSVMCLTVYT